MDQTMNDLLKLGKQAVESQPFNALIGTELGSQGTIAKI